MFLQNLKNFNLFTDVFNQFRSSPLHVYNMIVQICLTITWHVVFDHVIQSQLTSSRLKVDCSFFKSLRSRKLDCALQFGSKSWAVVVRVAAAGFVLMVVVTSISPLPVSLVRADVGRELLTLGTLEDFVAGIFLDFFFVFALELFVFDFALVPWKRTVIIIKPFFGRENSRNLRNINLPCSENVADAWFVLLWLPSATQGHPCPSQGHLAKSSRHTRRSHAPAPDAHYNECADVTEKTTRIYMKRRMEGY